ncbi:tetratricopeptide repeat protein [Candidatus Jidaibacter acanthamoebae]|nr:tetratricopeptide repeat protein [Candidatus Jidaibacter acanthamoeba]
MLYKYKKLVLLLLYILGILFPYLAFSSQDIKKVADNKASKVIIEPNNIPKNTNKNLTEQDLIHTIAEAIKPPIPTKEGVEINYGFTPAVPVNLGGNASKSTNLNIKIENQLTAELPLVEIINKGYRAALAGHYESAIFLYKKALVHDSDNINILYSLGIMYHKLRQFKEAKYYYKEVLKLKPDQPKALHNFLAVIAEESPEKGLQELMLLNKANPNYSPVLAQIGMIYARQGEYDKAESYLRKAMIISPQEILYKYNIAVMYDKIGKYKPALKLYKEIIEAGDSGEALPQSLNIIKQRARFLTTKGNG